MKYIIGIITGCVIVWLLQKAGILAALLLFVLAGVIPGTPFAIPPSIMLALLALVLLVVIRAIKRQGLIQQLRQQKAKHRHAQQPTGKATRRRFTPVQAQ